MNDLPIHLWYLPAGRLNTPAPTIDLIKLNTSLGIEAVPPSPPRGISAAAASAAVANRVLLLFRVDLVTTDDEVVGVTNAKVDWTETASTRTKERIFMVLVVDGGLKESSYKVGMITEGSK